MTKKRIFRIIFSNRGNIYELYARSVTTSELYAFVEVGEIIFGERTAILVDPSEEKLKAEFENVERTYIPMHSVVRIDEVAREGQNRIIGESDKGIVTPFPIPVPPSGSGHT